MGVPRAPGSSPGEKLERAEWIDLAVRLAKKGWSTRRIGAHPKVQRHHSTVADALNAEIDARRPTDEDIKRLREFKNERYEEQIAFWRKKSLAGDKDAASVLAKYEGLHSKLNGLDAPTSVSFDVSKMNDDDLRSLVSGASGAAEGSSPEGTASTGGEGEAEDARSSLSRGARTSEGAGGSTG